MQLALIQKKSGFNLSDLVSDSIRCLDLCIIFTDNLQVLKAYFETYAIHWASGIVDSTLF